MVELQAQSIYIREAQNPNKVWSKYRSWRNRRNRMDSRGEETYQTDNTIDSIVSSNAGDTQSVIVEGHTIDGNGDFTFVVQPATLNGQTPVTLSTPLARATRIYNNDSTDFAGTVYGYRSAATSVVSGVPQTTAAIHLQTDSNNQSLKAATTISKDDYWIISDVLVGVRRQQTRSVDFKFQVREKGKVFRTRLPFSGHSYAGTIPVPIRPYFIVRPNSDWRVNATSSGASTQVEFTALGTLAKIIGGPGPDA